MYVFYFNKYRQYVRDNIIRDTAKLIEGQVIDYLLSLKSKNLSQETISYNLSTIMHFYTMNDIILNRKKIVKFINTNQKKRGKNTGYTSEQIHKVLGICDERLKAMILIYASTGIRLAALPTLRIRDLTEVSLDDNNNQKLYRITIYEGYKEEYITFCTPECYRIIDAYLSYRARSGEVITQNSPLIREQFDLQDSFKARHPKAIDIKTITTIIRKKLVESGIREIEHIGIGNMGGSKMRKDVPLMHGFRKFFNTALMNADVHHSFKELLMGHLIRLDDVYYHKDSKKSRQKLLAEYCKALDTLTITEENRLKLENQQIKERNKTLERDKDEVILLRKELEPLLALKTTLIKEGLLRETVNS
jgi:integrase